MSGNGAEDTEEESDLFTSIDDATTERVEREAGRPVVDESDTKEPDSSSSVDGDDLVEAVSEIADTYAEDKEGERRHKRDILRLEMKYNLMIFAGLTALILLMTILTNIDPIAGFGFIAGLATGLGTNSALNTLRE